MPVPRNVYIIRLDFSHDLTVGSLYNVVDFYNGGRISIVDTVYDKMFKATTKNPRVRRGLFNDHIIEEETKGWKTYTYLCDFSAQYKLADFGSTKKSLSIIKEEINFKVTVEETFFISFIQKYLGDDPVIPYDLKGRKEKFVHAFTELESYIEKYNNGL